MQRKTNKYQPPSIALDSELDKSFWNFEKTLSQAIRKKINNKF